jgi:hypothetical protein
VLKDIHLPTLTKTLKELPGSINEAYEKIQGRILAGTHRTLAQKTLCWILKAARPLEMDELRDLLATEWGGKDCQNFRSPSKTILEACESLVVCQPPNSRGFVRFYHEKVREFVKDNYKLTFSLAEPCLAYLSFDKFAALHDTLRPTDFPDYKALNYVTNFWIFHLRSDSQIPEVQTAALKILASKPWREVNIRNVDFLPPTKAKDLTLLHILTLHRLPKLCLAAIDGGRNPKNPEVIFFSSD